MISGEKTQSIVFHFQHINELCLVGEFHRMIKKKKMIETIGMIDVDEAVGIQYLMKHHNNIKKL
jgi:hypothetical protein